MTKIFLTAPEEALSFRRGDPLGLRAVGDVFADILAPDLSNGTNDARWFTILSWCLKRSHDIYSLTSNNSINTLDGRRERYEWLRPLELMWVRRTAWFTDGANRYGLSGLQGIRQINDDNNASWDPAFGQTNEQLRMYRYRGIYARYARALRRLPGLTMQDGWTPDYYGSALASWLDERLMQSSAAPEKCLVDAPKTRPKKYSGGGESEVWRREWNNYLETGPREPHGKGPSQLLPRSPSDRRPLHWKEQEILKPAIFDKKTTNGSYRYLTAHTLEQVGRANHLNACKLLVAAFRRQPCGDQISALPDFSALADSATIVIHSLWKQLETEPVVSFREAARKIRKKDIEDLIKASGKWLSVKTPVSNRAPVDNIATQVWKVRSNYTAVVRTIALHHDQFASGLRWFRVGGEVIHQAMPYRDSSTPFVRFRLWALCRMATQVGLLKGVPWSIDQDPGAAWNENEEN